MFGAYEKNQKELIIEKDRSWASEIYLLNKILGKDPKILSPVRSIPEIIASFMIISEKIGATSKIEDEIRLSNRESNPWTLSRVIWEKYVYPNWVNFKVGYEERPECFFLIDYNDLVSRPQDTMDDVFEYLGVPQIEISTENLKNKSPENDAVYGMPGLHFIRPNLKRTSPPAKEILGEDCYDFWNEKKLDFWVRG